MLIFRRKAYLTLFFSSLGQYVSFDNAVARTHLEFVAANRTQGTFESEVIK